MRILACQTTIENVSTIGERNAHVRNLVRWLADECRQGEPVDLILLPELTTVEYSARSFELLRDLAEPMYSETYEEMRRLALRAGCAVAFGFPRVEDNRYFINQTVIGPSGQLLASYDKIHLAQFGLSQEKDYFTPGRSLGFFELGGWRFGLIICYDFRFSELVNSLVKQYQLDVLLHPVAFTRDGSYESWPHFVICRALEHQVYFLSVNRAGRYWGGSILCPPWIDQKTRAVTLGTTKETRLFTLDRSFLQGVRDTYPFRLDKLPDYSQLHTEWESAMSEESV
jgi:predicted amidohydrolase